MILQPKRVKFRKAHRGRRKGNATSGTTLVFGEYGLKAMEAAWVTARQIEAARIAVTRNLRKGGKMWIRIYPDKPVTKKPAETRMGSGKGGVDHYVAVVKPGRVILEMGGVEEAVARAALRIASHKLPIATRIVTRDRLQALASAIGEG